MIKIIITITAFLISLISLAQVSENREVSDFSKLQVSNSIDVLYTVSDKISVKVETDDLEKLKYIKTEVSNGILKLYVDTKGAKEINKDKSTSNKRSKLKNVSWINGVKFELLKITISGPNLESIKTSSSADVKIENTNTSTNLDIVVSSSGSISGNFNCTNATIASSSSGDVIGNINANSVEIEAGSSSDVKLSGKTMKLDIKASSSANVNLKEFRVENAVIKASSSADVYIAVSNSLEAKASSSASIVYYGNPSQVSKEESSSGSVSKK